MYRRNHRVRRRDFEIVPFSPKTDLNRNIKIDFLGSYTTTDSSRFEKEFAEFLLLIGSYLQKIGKFILGIFLGSNKQ